MSTEHPDYTKLAARISISNLHKDTIPSFKETMELVHTEPKVNSQLHVNAHIHVHMRPYIKPSLRSILPPPPPPPPPLSQEKKRTTPSL